MREHFEEDPERFNAPAYKVKGYPGVAFYVHGWEIVPDEDTEWTGQEARTGNALATMVGDNRPFRFDPDDLEPLTEEDFCLGCGQIGCQCYR